jgi:hypothetical protein
MKTLIAALAAVTTVTAFAAPAAAQSYDRYDGRHDNGRYEQARPNRGGYNLNERQEQLNRRIEIGARRGLITRREAADLREQSYEIARIEARYRYDGLNGWERADLDRRFDRLETRIAREIHDRDYGYGYGQRR